MMHSNQNLQRRGRNATLWCPVRLRSGLTAVVTALAMVLVGLPAQADATDPEWPSPAWHERELRDSTLGWERTADQYSHPVFLERQADMFLELEGFTPYGDRDPYRDDWAPVRGRVWEVAFHNRYCATLRGGIYAPPADFQDPVTGRPTAGPYPVVVVAVSYGANRESYTWLAQGLAEAGYVVLTFDPQGTWTSDDGDVEGDDCVPSEDLCDPHGEWAKPQEAGIREHGECAGMQPSPETDPQAIVMELLTGERNDETRQENYLRLVANQFFGTLDALEWLLGDAAPSDGEREWGELVDPTRVATAGHSLGAFAAMVAASVDDRVDAAVSLDGYGFFPEGADITRAVPTLFVGSELADTESPRTEPPEDSRAPTRNARRFVDAGIDTMAVYLRGSTHADFSYGLFIGAGNSRYGERIALHYTLAWLDRYAKAGEDARPRGDQLGAGSDPAAAQSPPGHDTADQRADALRRLTSRTFDGSADRSSIGLGRWDPLAQQNEPYLIEGFQVGDHLSYHFRSFAAFDGWTCDDVRLGCAS